MKNSASYAKVKCGVPELLCANCVRKTIKNAIGKSALPTRAVPFDMNHARIGDEAGGFHLRFSLFFVATSSQATTGGPGEGIKHRVTAAFERVEKLFLRLRRKSGR